MKNLLTALLLISAPFTNAQLKLDHSDLNNLISISQIYSRNPNARGEEFTRSIDSLRTTKLNHVVDVLITMGKEDKTILERRYLARPEDDELVMWYVIREIHYNRTDKKNTPRPDSVVANEILAGNIDSRWLLDNYYYRIHSCFASMFNNTDLSEYNIELDSLGFKDETEKGIFFLSIMDALVGGRFKVLQMMKNNKKILEFSDKLPKFNGKEYYHYKGFDYKDFEWIGFEKKESYNER
jgi:hypothetical protein